MSRPGNGLNQKNLREADFPLELAELGRAFHSAKFPMPVKQQLAEAKSRPEFFLNRPLI